MFYKIGGAASVQFLPQEIAGIIERLNEIRRKMVKTPKNPNYYFSAILINIHSHPGQAFISQIDEAESHIADFMIVVPNYGKGISIENFKKKIVVGIKEMDLSYHNGKYTVMVEGKPMREIQQPLKDYVLKIF